MAAKNGYRREALVALKSIEAQLSQNSAAQVAVLLKRTVLAAYPLTRLRTSMVRSGPGS